MHRTFLALLPLASVALGCAAGDSEPSASDPPADVAAPEDLGHAKQELYVNSNKIWKPGDIKVCWENNSGFATERGWVRDQIRRTWETHSAVRFLGWDQCPAATWPADDHLRIQVTDEWPRTLGLGADLRGKKNGVIFNFGDYNFTPHQRWATQQGGWDDSEKWVAGDFDGDGRPDMAKAFNDGGTISIDVHRNASNGTFAMQRWATQKGGWDDSQQWMVGDFNKDGRTDLAVAWNDWGLISVDVYVNKGAGGFTQQRWATQQGGWADSHEFLAGDFDNDGWIDIATAFDEWGLVSIDVHRNNHAGGFAHERWATQQGGWADSSKFVVGDFDSDGRTDIAMAWDHWGQISIEVFKNYSWNSFQPSRWATQQGGWDDSEKWVAGDFDRNGRTDIVTIWNQNGESSMDIHASTGGSFTWGGWATRQGGWQDTQKWTAADFDGDGWLDLGKAWDDWGNISIDVTPGARASAAARENNIRWIAAHEFGHALGFAHEQNRPDTPGSCTSAPQGSKGDTVLGAWDLNSIMNYCNPVWNNGGQLSAGDIAGVQQVYGPPNQLTWQLWGKQQGGWDGTHKWAAGDFNGDGRADLVNVWNDWGSISFDTHLSQGTSFGWMLGGRQQGGWDDSHKVVVADWNGDGKTDVGVAWNEWGNISFDIHTGNGNGTFGWASAFHRYGGFDDTESFVVGDFNGDQRSDFAVVWDDWGYISIDLYLNDGAGHFSVIRGATQQGGFEANERHLAGDFNGDGFTDIATAWNDGGRISIDLHLNDKTGHFNWQRWITQAGGWDDSEKWVAGDFNRDGRIDLEVAWNDSGLISVGQYRNTGSGFAWETNTTRQGGFDASERFVAADFDGDGAVDLATIWNDGGLSTLDMHRNGNLIDNGGFELANVNGWTSYGTAQANVVARSGYYGMRIGSLNVSASSSNLYRWVYVPTTGTTTLSYGYQSSCADAGDQALMYLYVNSTSAWVPLHTSECANVGSWTTVVTDLTPYAGQWLAVYGFAYDNGGANTSYLRVDDIAVVNR